MLLLGGLNDGVLVKPPLPDGLDEFEEFDELPNEDEDELDELDEPDPLLELVALTL